MDPTTLMLSLLLGIVGFGFLLYARNAGRLLPAAAGVALVVCPYLISNVIYLLVVCAVLIAAPFIVRAA